MKTVLITGAAGRLGAHLRRGLAGRYHLRLTDVHPIDVLAGGESFVLADLERMEDMLRATEGVDAVVHLGGIPVEASWDAILPANIVGCYNVFEAARANGVQRMVFASSNHVTGFYRRDEIVDHASYPRPDSRYAVAKVFGEQLGSLYSSRYGMEVCCMRLGHVHPRPLDERRLSIWISPRDLAQLVRIGIEHPDIRYEIVYGVSANDRSWYDNSNAWRLGYRPEDNSEQEAAAIMEKNTESSEDRSFALQGGSYTSPEIDGALPPIPRPAGKG